MVRRLRSYLAALGLAAGGAAFLAALPAPAFEGAFHFHATYVLARHAGLDHDTSVRIAGADWGVDTVYAGPLSSARPGRRALATLASVATVVWPVVLAVRGGYDGPGDYVGKLSDWAITRSARAVHFPLEPGQRRVTPWDGQPGHQAGLLLELALRERDPVLLGIALHAVQDSCSHAGLYPVSHFGRGRLVDSLTTPTSRERARRALRATYRALVAFRERLEGERPAALPWAALEPGLERWLAWLASPEATYRQRYARLHELTAPGVPLPPRAIPPGFARARERVRAWVDRHAQRSGTPAHPR